MHPVTFYGANRVLGADQPEYQPLPVHIEDSPYKCATACWQLTWRERLRLLITGKIWQQTYTFGRSYLPQLLSVERPEHLPPAQRFDDVNGIPYP